MYLKKLAMIGLSVTLAVVLSAGSSYACHPWFNVNNYTVEKGPIRFHIAYGHNFPFGHSFFDNEQIENLYMLGPEGKRQEVGPRELKDGKLSQVQFESKGRLKEGIHLVVMESKGHFRAKTAKGWQRKSKAELKGEEVKGDVIFSQNYCKAIVNVGGKGGGGSYSRILGHGLEIVPLKDPAELRTNDILPIKVLHKGKPIEESVTVYATYMGFSNEKDVFAYTALVSPCKKGIAKIRLLQPGIWMVFVNHKFPYPNSKLADVYSYQATLTFEVKP